MKYISLLLFILLLCGCKQQELLNHLDQQQANDVLAVLQRHNINAEKKDQGKTGFSIFVEPTDFASAVDWLKIYNLPGKPDIQISQMFPADALVSSPRAEKARLYSAIEQRLEQSLKIMDGIVSSRVHVSYDVDTGDSGKTALPIHISVLAVYEKDINPEIKINDIKRLLLIVLQAYNMKIFLLYCQNEETLLSKHQHMKLANLFLLMIRLCRFLSYLH